jgi:tetratricopeptide (TPR) repeat protein
MAAGCSDRATLPDRHAGSDLDGLFSSLRTAGSSEEAERIEIAILGVLAESGQEDVDSMTLKGIQALNDGDLEKALILFEQVVHRAPRFVEGWNLRATVYWMQDDYGRAINDLRRVLVLEPRHFGALTLLGRIFAEMKQPQAAMVMFERALEINPHLDTARKQIDLLRDQVAGIPI